MANSQKSPLLLLPSRRTPPPIKRRDAARRGATRCDATRRGEGDELSSGDMARGSRRKGWARGAVAFAAVAAAVAVGRRYGWDGRRRWRRSGAEGRAGPWAAPAYVAAHALTLALCPPYAILFEGAAALLFGFLPGVACVFSAKVLGASLSFWIGRYGTSSSSSSFFASVSVARSARGGCCAGICRRRDLDIPCSVRACPDLIPVSHDREDLTRIVMRVV